MSRKGNPSFKWYPSAPSLRPEQSQGSSENLATRKGGSQESIRVFQYGGGVPRFWWDVIIEGTERAVI
eukprot:119057-Hanusia_phi.AAC.1